MRPASARAKFASARQAGGPILAHFPAWRPRSAMFQTAQGISGPCSETVRAPTLGPAMRTSFGAGVVGAVEPPASQSLVDIVQRMATTDPRTHQTCSFFRPASSRHRPASLALAPSLLEFARTCSKSPRTWPVSPGSGKTRPHLGRVGRNRRCRLKSVSPQKQPTSPRSSPNRLSNEVDRTLSSHTTRPDLRGEEGKEKQQSTQIGAA